MSKKVGVLFIHGMGDTKADFHLELENELKERLGDKVQSVQFQSCYWQPILQKREEILWEKLLSNNSNMDKKKMRKWIINALGDPVGYLGGEHKFYHEIHLKVRDELEQLLSNLENDGQSPLVILAHSLGSAIISNYIWDEQHPEQGQSIGRNDFEKMQTLTTLVTFGSNIPLFTLAYDPVECITFPPKELSDNLKSAAKWMNFFDPDDILGYPLNDIWDKRNGTVTIEDIDINAGWWPISESPLSHNHYWTDNDLTKPVTKQIKKIVEIIS